MRASPLCSSTRQGRAGRRGVLLKPAAREWKSSAFMGCCSSPRRAVVNPAGAGLQRGRRQHAPRYRRGRGRSPFSVPVAAPFPAGREGAGAKRWAWGPGGEAKALGTASTPWMPVVPRRDCPHTPGGRGLGIGRDRPCGRRDWCSRPFGSSPRGPRAARSRSPHFAPQERERERHERHVAGCAEVHAAWAECWWGLALLWQINGLITLRC